MAQYFTRPKSMAVEGTVFKSSEFHTKIDRKKKIPNALKHSYNTLKQCICCRMHRIHRMILNGRHFISMF